MISSAKGGRGSGPIQKSIVRKKGRTESSGGSVLTTSHRTANMRKMKEEVDLGMGKSKRPDNINRPKGKEYHKNLPP